MDLFAIPLIILLVFWLFNKIKGFIEMLFPNLPEWHNLHGKEYIKWKEMSDDDNKPTQ